MHPLAECRATILDGGRGGLQGIILRHSREVVPADNDRPLKSGNGCGKKERFLSPLRKTGDLCYTNWSQPPVPVQFQMHKEYSQGNN
ncbi:hypothetical protein MCOR27_010212 [Pyricularia oryzae]|uniref:Uncharacterized protein n=3 Tax=Pyricularia oryzae TaxID=318829 RepID=G4N6D9_PYRO7|nr:uncharacterized protein MGG_17168 [Pyricularia oryzae 70-15]ELQ44868.1 hypothetical protein OOU_Y34scaffold00037g10 [Pyricularia oryzae Y34]KAI6268285.1 hypothetical protein MCOR27_010212 [Pyricularia oryzae]EHA50661.1 hypothetical protein MGG_17168 [Pyricularia oryzae 70-15]KAI6331412.1 hypothetical protein MCOR30_004772 [Pyricularia oryzae]KAI6373293.1 hypothetical protein MCOR32_005745 [Pyricularia oryzae]